MEGEGCSPRRILVGVSIAEWLDAKSRLELEQSPPDVGRLGGPACRGETGREKSKIGRIVRILRHRFPAPRRSFLVVSAGVAGKAKGGMRVEEMGVERREYEPDLGPALGFCRLAKVAVGRTAADPGHGRVGTGGQGPIEQGEGTFVVVKQERPYMTAEGKRPCIEGIQLEGRFGEPVHRLIVAPAVLRPSLPDPDAMPDGREGIGGDRKSVV